MVTNSSKDCRDCIYWVEEVGFCKGGYLREVEGKCISFRRRRSLGIPLVEKAPLKEEPIERRKGERRRGERRKGERRKGQRRRQSYPSLMGLIFASFGIIRNRRVMERRSGVDRRRGERRKTERRIGLGV